MKNKPIRKSPIERLLENILSEDGYVTCDDICKHGDALMEVYNEGVLTTPMCNELADRFCRTFG